MTNDPTATVTSLLRPLSTDEYDAPARADLQREAELGTKVQRTFDDSTRARLSGLRRRQPLLRTNRRVHAVAFGGDHGAFTACAPVFDAFASTVVRLGDVGAGQVAKLLNNALFVANLAVADGALTLGEALGVDAAELVHFLQNGSGRSYGVEIAYRCRISPETRAAA